jgi:hypothetical protein
VGRRLALLACLLTGLMTNGAALAAPPLTQSSATNWLDLGTWDDACVLNGLDLIVVRRGDAFHSLAVTNGFAPSPLAATPAARDSRIVGSAHGEGRLWVFLQRAAAEPCAVDLLNGQVVTFATTPIRAPWGRGPQIQSHLVLPHANAALLMIAGGSGRPWPRPGNRPFYFWLNLASAKQVSFNPDWDLDFFDQHQLVAVFKARGRGTYHAIDMRTGLALPTVPDRRRVPVVPFDWTDQEPAQPVWAFQSTPPDPNLHETLVGVTRAGRVYPLGLTAVRDRKLITRRIRDGHIAFSLTPVRPVPAQCYLRQDAAGAPPALVSTSATDCVLLDGGDCLYVAAQNGPHGPIEDAWYRPGDGAAQWNLLEGIPRLPALPASLAGKTHLEDRLRVRLLEAFGSAREPALALCQFEHQQTDLRAHALRPAAVPIGHMASQYWRRTMIVGRDRRLVLPVLGSVDHQDRPDLLWLHTSGCLIAGQFAGSDDQRTVSLRAIRP